MKIKVTTGGGMRGVIKYDDKPGSEFIGGTQSSSNDFLRETAALRELRPECKKPVLHFSLSQPPGEPLSNEQWREAVNKFMSKMGLENHSFYCKRHTDTDHDHIHIAVNKIGFNGKLWDTDKSAKRGMKACSEIEQEMNLTQTKTLADYRKETGFKNRGINNGAVRQFERTGTLPNLTKRAITRRKAAENERDKQNRAARDESTTKRTIDAPADRPINPTGIQSVRADQKIANAAGGNNQHQQQKYGRDLRADFNNGEADRPAIKEPQKTILAKDFQLKEVTTMQKRNGAQAQAQDQIDDDTPPTLGGRLRAEAREKAGKQVWDLYWQDCLKPTFCYRPADRSLELLATPTPQNVTAFFDACQEKGMKPLQLYGDDQFLRLAVEEAQKRGYPLDTSDPKVKAIYEQLNAAPAPGSVITPALSSTTPTPNLFAAVADRAMRSASKHLKF